MSYSTGTILLKCDNLHNLRVSFSLKKVLLLSIAYNIFKQLTDAITIITGMGRFAVSKLFVI